MVSLLSDMAESLRHFPANGGTGGGVLGPVPQERGTRRGLPSPDRSHARSDQTVRPGTTEEVPRRAFPLAKPSKFTGTLRI